jgi:potassium-transporting ATPase KdpC subunit
MIRQLIPALRVLVVLSLLTGVVYPLAVTGIAQGLFPEKANGSRLRAAGRIQGSSLIGQPFDEPRYFWGRLSGTGPVPYDAGASSGTNYGPLNEALREGVEARVKALRDADPGNTRRVPVDLVTASGSGLDPHISPAAALYQVPRVARARHLREEEVRALLKQHTAGRQLGILGEPTVNVLELNLALDRSR